MTRAPGWIVALAAGSLVVGPVLGLIAGATAGAAGGSDRVALNVSLVVGLLAVWVGQAGAFGAYWVRRPKGWATDRVMIVTGTMTVVCPGLVGLALVSWAF